MSDRSRVVLIFAVVLLLAGGGGFYFFKVYRPAQDLKNAQAEIKAWETERWQAVRDCLLGKTPGSSKTSEALAIREMAPDPWEGGKCTPLVSKLVRGDAPDTGNAAVEKAWEGLNAAATKAAMAFADHVSKSTTLKDDPLPGALDALDAARTALRAAAQLPATEQTAKPLAAAQIVPITDGADAVTSLQIDSVPSARGMVLFGKTANRIIQLVLTAGGAPKAGRVGPSSIRAVPDTSWGATPDATEVKVGTFDVEGVIAAPTSLKTPVVGPSVAVAVGTPADGAVVYGVEGEMWIARAKGGTFTAEPSTKIAWAGASSDVDGRAVVLWKTPEPKFMARIIKPGAEDEVLEMPGETIHLPCLTADRAWAYTVNEVYSFGGGRPLFRKSLEYTKLLGCTADAALFRAGGGEIHVCQDDCRTVPLPKGAATGSAVTAVGGKLVAITSHGGVLGVWREGAEPTFYALSDAVRPVTSHGMTVMAMTDGKVIDVLATSGEAHVIIRIPAN